MFVCFLSPSGHQSTDEQKLSNGWGWYRGVKEVQIAGLETAQRPKGGIGDVRLPKLESGEIRMAAEAIRRNFNFLGQWLSTHVCQK